MRLALKIISVVLSGLMACTSGAGDKRQAEDGEKKPLEGAWEIKRAEGSMAGMNVGTVYEFIGNKLNLLQGTFVNPGVTEITETTFSFQAEGNEYKFVYDYTLQGDTLVAHMQGSNQTFYLVRK